MKCLQASCYINDSLYQIQTVSYSRPYQLISPAGPLEAVPVGFHWGISIIASRKFPGRSVNRAEEHGEDSFCLKCIHASSRLVFRRLSLYQCTHFLLLKVFRSYRSTCSRSGRFMTYRPTSQHPQNDLHVSRGKYTHTSGIEISVRLSIGIALGSTVNKMTKAERKSGQISNFEIYYLFTFSSGLLYRDYTTLVFDIASDLYYQR